MPTSKCRRNNAARKSLIGQESSIEAKTNGWEFYEE